jgi:hypothetical protein
VETDPSGSQRHPDDPGEPTTGEPRLSVTGTEAAILTALCHKLTVAEIGTGLGVSTAAMAASAELVHTVDIDPWVHSTIWPTLPPNVKRLTSADRLPRVVDAVFIDGDHGTEATRRDLREAHDRATVLILIHDVNYDTVRKAIDDIDRWTIIPTEHGLGVKWLT